MDTMQEWTVDDLPELSAMIEGKRRELKRLEEVRDALLIVERGQRIKALKPDWFFGMELAVIPDVLSFQNMKHYDTVFLVNLNEHGATVGTRAVPYGSCWSIDTDLVARMRVAYVEGRNHD